MTEKRHLYVIAEPGPLGTVRACKIGIAKDPRDRLRSLQTGNWRKLKLAYISPPCREFFDVENSAHKRVVGNRLGGEWFSCDVRDAVAAVRLSYSEIVGVPKKPTLWQRLKGLFGQR